jgi:hypothetical protein
MSVSWDILISSLVHRTDMLVELLEEFERQREPNVGVIVFRDNTETIYGEKCQRLLKASEADYVSFLSPLSTAPCASVPITLASTSITPRTATTRPRSTTRYSTAAGLTTQAGCCGT